MPNWKEEITQRIGETEPSMLEELAQHLEARFEELQSYDAVMSEWSAGDLHAELARIMRRRREPAAPGNPAAGLWQDVRYGLRQLRLNPGFATVAILSLALGIGANTAIFQLLNAVRLRSLPVANPQELVNVHFAKIHSASGSFRGTYGQSTYAMWQQVRTHGEGFSGMFAWGTEDFDLATSGQRRYTRDALWVSGDFYQVLGVHALLGRVFTAADDPNGSQGCASPGVVISHAFWQREFGGDSNVVGRKITLNRVPLEIIGVTPPGFYGVEVGRSYDLALPLCAAKIFAPEQLTRGNVWWLAIMGRLKPAWSVERASAQLAAASPAILQASVYEKWNAANTSDFLDAQLGAVPAAGGLSELRHDYKDSLELLLLIAGLVLLIACANLANLMLARGAVRQKEIAVRLALGASQLRLIRQLLVESALLAAAGTVLGALLARNLSRLLIAFLRTADQPVFVDLGSDWRVFAFLAGLAVATCLLFGLVPALRAARAAPVDAMKNVGRGISESRQGSRLRHALLVSQLSLSLVLLIGSFLFIRSLRNLVNVDAGFQQTGILVTQYNFSDLHLAPQDRLALRRDLLRRAAAVPGVESVASGAIVPISDSFSNDNVQMEGEKSPRVEVVNFNRVSPGYFATVGAPLLAGRDFDTRDQPGAFLAAVITETFVRRLTPNANPLGRRFRVNGDRDDPDRIYEIVGVVKDSKYATLRENFSPLAYLAAAQDSADRNWDNILIRSAMRSGQALPPLMSGMREVMQEASPKISYQFVDFEAQVNDSLRQDRLMAALSSAFGMLALILSTVGLYGVISFTVARRTQEIGIRMALGADRARISTLILREASWLLAAGLAAGSAMALYVLRLAEKMLYGLEPQDPWSFVASATVLAGVALAASYVPARRAARLDPMVALRQE
jgi:putative ABC transport system permease protein